MITAIVNGQVVLVEIIEADGQSGDALEQTEFGLITAIDAHLRKHPDFAKAYPGARLTRIDSNRMLLDTEEGRFYLRYRHDGGDAEFWGHRAAGATFDLASGVTTVGSDNEAA